MLTNMVELLQNDAAVVMNGIGNAAKVGYHGIVIMAKISPCQHRGTMHRHWFNHDHRRTTDGAFLIIGTVPLCRQALFGHVGGVGAEYDAVSQCFVAQLDGLEQFGKWVHIACMVVVCGQYTCCFSMRKRIYFPAFFLESLVASISQLVVLPVS